MNKKEKELINKFNKKEYDIKYKKEHLSQINFTINKELKEQFYNKLKENNIKPIEFFKKTIKDYLK